jgi:fibrillarin-like pre-rRNA processing protein
MLQIENNMLVTENLTPGLTFYGETTYKHEDKEYRSWNPTRSKLGAAIMKGLKHLPLKQGSNVLYLGVASGTTCSHISDIVGTKGHIWALDFAPRSLRDFLDKVTKYRNNISPIFEDARHPQKYQYLVPMVDIIYADVAQPNQADIVVNNAKYFLKNCGWVMLSIKSRSIDVSLEPKKIYAVQANILEKEGFRITEIIELAPYEKDHAMAIAVLK